MSGTFTLLNAITSELLSRNDISDEEAEVLQKISVPQHFSKGVADNLLDYSYLKKELVVKVSEEENNFIQTSGKVDNRIKSVTIDKRPSTGRIEPFWDFVSQKNVAILVLNRH